MKNSDIASLILIVTISFVIAFFIGNAVLNTPESRSAQVEIVNSFEASIQAPDAKVFHSEAINAAVDINIDEANTDTPFEE